MNPLLTQAQKREIMDLAERWWDRTGRHLVPHAINEVRGPPKVRHGNGPTIVVSPSPERDLNDGILESREWSQLNSEEQAKVMLSYFEHHWLPEHPEVAIERKRRAH